MICVDYEFSLVEISRQHTLDGWYKISRDKGATVEEAAAKKALCRESEEQKLRKKSRGRRRTRRISGGAASHSRFVYKITQAKVHIYPVKRKSSLKSGSVVDIF